MNIHYNSSSQNLRASLKDEGILLALSLANKKKTSLIFLRQKEVWMSNGRLIQEL